METVDNLKSPQESEMTGLIEILPGTDLRGKDTPETKEVLSETGEERIPEKGEEETLEGDTGTTQEKEGERTPGKGDMNILKIGEENIQGKGTGSVLEEEKIQGKGTEGILEEG